MLKFKLGWYLIYTRPKQERRAAKELSELNIDVYLPLVNQSRKWHDRMKTIESPLFPSYLFVKISNLKDLYRVAKVGGFVCYVRLGKQIAIIRDSIIEDLKRFLINKSDVELCNNYFPIGHELTIPDGPFAGTKCEIINYNGANKVIVRMEVLSRSVLINISKDILYSA